MKKNENKIKLVTFQKMMYSTVDSQHIFVEIVSKFILYE